MQCRFLALTVIFFLVTNISGSSQNKQQYEKILDKETSPESATSSKGKFKNVKNIGFYPDSLPQWFFQIPEIYSGIVAVGVSDPDMELSLAKEQAIFRAKSMALLYEKATVQYFRDIYSKAIEVEKYTTYRERFDTYFKISAQALISDNLFAVLDTHVTRYNEYVVLLQYSPLDSGTVESDNVYKLKVLGSGLMVEASFDEAIDNQAEYEFCCTIPDSATSINADFIFREKGLRFLTSSEYNGSKIDYPVYPYKYVSNASTSVTSLPLTSYSGLWSVCTRQLIRYLSLNAQNSSIKLKNMNDDFQEEAVNLTREIASFYARLKINGIKFDNDTLKMDIELKDKQSTF